jgi:hypothetical protein
MLARDAQAAADGKPVELYEVDELDHVEWARTREAKRCHACA